MLCNASGNFLYIYHVWHISTNTELIRDVISVYHFQNNRTCRQIPSHGSPHFYQFTQFSPVSLLQTSFHRNCSFCDHPRSPRQCNSITKYHASAYSTSLLLSTLLTMTSWSPVSHPGLVSMALFSAGSSHICHLIASVSNVKLTCRSGTHPPAVSPDALSLVLYSSSCSLHHSSQYSHFLLFPKPSPLRR